MEKLEKKTFYTIFSIISLFIIVTTIIFNFQSYRKEYSGIKTNLTRLNMMIFGVPNRNPFNQDLMFENLNDKIIMDYDFYTFILDRNNNIIHKISHNENSFDNKIINKANNIIKNNYNSRIKINSLYLSDLSYNLKFGEYLVIVDTSNIRIDIISNTINLFLIFDVSTITKNSPDLKLYDVSLKYNELIFNLSLEFLEIILVALLSILLSNLFSLWLIL